MNKIADIQLMELVNRLSKKGITIEIGEDAKELISRRGYDAKFGARPLKRTIEKMLYRTTKRKDD